ncbi:DUF2285 domain-containing protein [Bradyrhizobium sp. 150]|uniref:DUF2285 domain-containing protein n=1 Tax=Bradyrhizobium sp. 150 TaxID=2782625 RepID=UPI001FFB66D8|nr:DUF2285 domain-containing protein [Bradyrhizobium sp. 150]
MPRFSLSSLKPEFFTDDYLNSGERLSAAIRALDARSARSSYRTVAEALFGKKRIPDRAWKTHDLRNRTVRLVKGGLTLVRGGYRKLLRPGRRNE